MVEEGVALAFVLLFFPCRLRNWDTAAVASVCLLQEVRESPRLHVVVLGFGDRNGFWRNLAGHVPLLSLPYMQQP